MIILWRGVIITVAVIGGVGLSGCSGHSVQRNASSAPTLTAAPSAALRTTPVRPPAVRVSTPAPARTPTPNDHQLPSGAARSRIFIPALRESAPIDNPCIVANGKVPHRRPPIHAAPASGPGARR